MFYIKFNKMDEFDTSGFYKLNEENEIMHAPNFVGGPNGFRLYRNLHETYTYPQQGWYWFDSLEEACAFFGIPVPEQN